MRSIAPLVDVVNSAANHVDMTDSNEARRGKVTPENLEEARLLKAIWDATYEQRRLKDLHTQGAFGAEYDVGNQAAVGFFLNGKTALSIKAARGFAKGLGCAIADFSPRIVAEIEAMAAATAEQHDEDFALVERADVAVSAGHGCLIFHEGRKSGLSFRRDFLRAQGVSEANAVVVDVKGRSMEPTITDGAVLLINRAAKEVINGKVYAFRADGELLVKRLHRRDGQLIAVSDNPDRGEYPDRVLDPNEDFDMIGRALWMGARI